jgi:hypothetical protein
MSKLNAIMACCLEIFMLSPTTAITHLKNTKNKNRKKQQQTTTRNPKTKTTQQAAIHGKIGF